MWQLLAYETNSKGSVPLKSLQYVGLCNLNMSKPSRFNLKIGVTLTALLITFSTWLMLNVELLSKVLALLERAVGFQVVRYPVVPRFIELILLSFVVNFLLYGSTVFILTRLGYLKRSKQHRPAQPHALAQIYDRTTPPALTILVPSYKEEPAIVTRTLLSAALMEYPRRRVVLLIDNPPESESTEDQELLATTQQLPLEVTALLQAPDQKLKAAAQLFEARKQAGSLDIANELFQLAKIYQEVAFWFQEQARSYPATDHAARFYVQTILGRPAQAHQQRAREILTLIVEDRSEEDMAVLSREYRRLTTLFEVELVSFERKQYGNLSHEANKAMNLNSYIALIGGDWTPFQFGEQTYLQKRPPGQGELRVPNADYIITLDADSLLVHDYALRLVHEMEKPEFERVAIAQTPYSAFPGALEPLEKIAGAQTDMQYVVHQGFTHHRATFWVGANALLRYKALEFIVVEAEERGHRVKKYIQDRTVIEDTESSIDLINNGWRLFNYPSRLAYSATPPDFGSLLIQRRRWANGGLIIFPKMMGYLLHGPGRLRKLPEIFLRTHYLISTAMTNLGLLVLILYGFDVILLSPWLIVAVSVYFLIYAITLKETGYRRRDLFGVIALNLLLIPVNLAGALKSLIQAVTGRRVAFGRTPKVEHRTASPAWLPLFQILLAAYCLIQASIDLFGNELLDSGFAALNGLILLYAITIYIGWGNSMEDIKLALPQRISPYRSAVKNPPRCPSKPISEKPIS